jgi:hypothetical protein
MYDPAALGVLALILAPYLQYISVGNQLNITAIQHRTSTLYLLAYYVLALRSLVGLPFLPIISNDPICRRAFVLHYAFLILSPVKLH